MQVGPDPDKDMADQDQKNKDPTVQTQEDGAKPTTNDDEKDKDIE